MKPIALTNFLGLPVVALGGLSTLILFIFAASIAYLNRHDNHTIPFKWHPRIAITAIFFAIIHALFGLSILLNS